MKLDKIVKASIFAGTSIGLGFAFVFIPNVEFISVTVFISGMYLGFPFGILIGFSTMLIYSVLNPMGSGLIHLPLLFSQLIAMAGIGGLGSAFRQIFRNMGIKNLMLVSGILGFICTVWYDMLTSLSYPLSAGYSWEESMAFAISGFMFTIIHVISNCIIFSVVVPGFIKRLNN